MIDILYDRPGLRVTVTGHACAGEPGLDPVCAGVSALVYTLAAHTVELGTAALRLDPGDAYIALRPRRGCRPVAQLVFDVLCGGLSLIADNHPDNVRYTVKEQPDRRNKQPTGGNYYVS